MTMRGRLIGLLIVAAGCSDPAGSTVDGPATTDATAAACPAGQFCLRVNKVVPSATIPDGRLVVVFYQLNDDLVPYPVEHVARDVVFPGTLERTDFALDTLALPAAIDDYQVCPRSCPDLTDPACDCPPAQPKAALAFVFVFLDTDSSGAIERFEMIDANMIGTGFVQLGASDADYPVPNVLDGLFTEGILDGVVPYRIIPPTTGPFDVLGLAPAGMVFDLDVCVPGDASCDMLRTPNLT